MQCTIFNLLVRRRRASYHVDVFCAWLSVGSLSVKSKSTPEIIYGLSPIMKYEMPAVQSVPAIAAMYQAGRQAKCKKIAWSSEISWAGTYQICCKTAMTRLPLYYQIGVLYQIFSLYPFRPFDVLPLLKSTLQIACCHHVLPWTFIKKSHYFCSLHASF